MKVSILINDEIARKLILEEIPNIFPDATMAQFGGVGDVYVASPTQFSYVPKDCRVYLWPDRVMTKGSRKNVEQTVLTGMVELIKPKADYVGIPISEAWAFQPEGELMSMDVETVSIEDKTLIGVSTSIEDYKSRYFYGEDPTLINMFIKDWAEKNTTIWHNGVFDISSFNGDARHIDNDTMVMAYLLNYKSGTLSLEDMVKAVLNEKHYNFWDFGYKKQGFTGSGVSIPHMIQKSGGDADHTRRLYLALEKELRKWDLEYIYRTLEMPLVPILSANNRCGIRLNLEEKNSQFDIYENKYFQTIDVLVDIFKDMGVDINWRSNDQLADLLYKQLKLPVTVVTDSGKPSVDSEALKEIEKLHPIPSIILKLRQYEKLMNFLSYQDEILHMRFNQCSVVTGRLSASDFVQQIPPDLRGIFIPREGYTMIGADYSQAEFFIMAHAAGMTVDPSNDIHSYVCEKIYKEVTPKLRKKAKNANFALAYGAQGKKFMEMTDSTKEEADHFLDMYKFEFPLIWKYQIEQRASAINNGYVRTLAPSKRIRFLPDAMSEAGFLREEALRQAVNTPIQGTSADITKSAIIELAKYAPQFGAHLLLFIHDEIISEVPTENAEEWRQLVEKCMLEAPHIPPGLRMKTDAKMGYSWKEVK